MPDRAQARIDEAGAEPAAAVAAEDTSRPLVPNDEKAAVRQRFARGEIGRDELMAAETASYHGPGTCTFYGTANSNQMLMEFMGLYLPGASFVNPGTPLREALTRAAARRALAITANGNSYTPASAVLDERAFVNGMVDPHATGGSTNLTLHLIEMARAAGVLIDWGDMAALSAVTPLIARVYPNGLADVNHFHAAGGLGFMIGELLEAGAAARRRSAPSPATGWRAIPRSRCWSDDGLAWREGTRASLNERILRPAADPFRRSGGAHRAGRQPRSGGDQDLGGQAGAPCHRGPRRGVRAWRPSRYPGGKGR